MTHGLMSKDNPRTDEAGDITESGGEEGGKGSKEGVSTMGKNWHQAHLHCAVDDFRSPSIREEATAWTCQNWNPT